KQNTLFQILPEEYFFCSKKKPTTLKPLLAYFFPTTYEVEPKKRILHLDHWSFFIEETVRKYIYQNYYAEIPYTTKILVKNFDLKRNTSWDIHIILAKKSQRKLFVGKKNEKFHYLKQRTQETIIHQLCPNITLSWHITIAHSSTKDLEEHLVKEI